MAHTLPGLREARQDLLEQLVFTGARTALDIGCGTGEDVTELARLLPQDAELSGLDASETMISEARRRTAGLGGRVSLRTGDAASLPYQDRAFDICRASTVLQHVPDPARAVSEMARVTRPGGRVGVLELDQETVFLDHPDPGMTRTIMASFADAMAQGRMGRQLPRLLRAAGLTQVSVTMRVVHGSAEFWRNLMRQPVAHMQDEGLLDGQQVTQWWAGLDSWAQAGDFLAGAIVFVATASRPA